jgi:hypothetical protein
MTVKHVIILSGLCLVASLARPAVPALAQGEPGTQAAKPEDWPLTGLLRGHARPLYRVHAQDGPVA